MHNSQNFTENYKMLNPAQKQAVDTIEGPVLVVAGPGTGKTQLLSVRIANILKQTDTEPQNTLCLTFTDAAAKNMQERLGKIIGPEGYKVNVFTFHSFAQTVIEDNPEDFLLESSFQPAGDFDSALVFEEIFESLDYDNPLKVKDPTGNFLYKNDLQNLITGTKKQSLDPQEFKQITQENHEQRDQILEIIEPVLSLRLNGNKNKESLVNQLVPEAISKLQALEKPLAEPYNPIIKPITNTVLEDLLILEENLNGEYNKPAIDKFRKTWKNFADKKYPDRYKKLLATADFLEKYNEKMYSKSLYDFNDMLLWVVDKFKENPDLALDYQEKFQYILVDEFQDTNEVQMELVDCLLNMEITEERPNILVVGDDDQSIYKFQGAKINNLKLFADKYNPELITLNTNYRSTKKVLTLAEQIITQNTTRAADLLELTKNLNESGHKETEQTDIEYYELETKEEELYFIATKIQKLLKSNEKPEKIAVIGRDNRSLKEFSKLATVFEIPVYFQQNENILEDVKINQLLTLLEFSLSLNTEDIRQDLIPAILNFEFLEIDRKTVFDIAEKAIENKKTWWQICRDYDTLSSPLRGSVNKVDDGVLESKTPGTKIQNLIEALETINQKAENEPVERIFDLLIGNTESHKNYTIPFKTYYFPDEKLQNQTTQTEYLKNLSNLKTLYSSVRDFVGNQNLLAHEFMEVLNDYTRTGQGLFNLTKFNTPNNAVNILTAHKAKGLEFKHVFLLNCNKETWTNPRAKGHKINLPPNLPLYEQSDDIDDQIRLFFVALTRAENHLYLTSHVAGGGRGKVKNKLDIIQNSLEAKTVTFDTDQRNQILEHFNEAESTPQFGADEKQILQKLVENYKLSVTHLNNFLDVEEGGPHKFLTQNLLQFPQSYTDSAMYGSAIHEALHEFRKVFSSEQKLPSFDLLASKYKYALNKQKLTEIEYKKYIKQGLDNLEIYFENQIKQNWKTTDKTELNFSYQEVVVDDARLKGKLDRVIFDEENKEILVADFKTGKALSGWESKDIYESQKAENYKRQLIFYNLLVENSKDYSNYNVKTGQLEFIDSHKVKDENGEVLQYNITKNDVEKMKKLVKAVYTKIVNLDFPNPEELQEKYQEYKKPSKKTEAFVEDLIAGVG